MEGLKNMLLAEQARLEAIIAKVQNEKQNLPDGRLRVSVDKGYIRYYHCLESEKAEAYIRRDKMELARGLAQKGYNEKILKLAEKRLAQICMILADYDDREIENCYYEEHLAKRRLIQPVESTWEEQVEDWLKDTYEGKPFLPSYLKKQDKKFIGSMMVGWIRQIMQDRQYERQKRMRRMGYFRGRG